MDKGVNSAAYLEALESKAEDLEKRSLSKGKEKENRRRAARIRAMIERVKAMAAKEAETPEKRKH